MPGVWPLTETVFLLVLQVLEFGIVAHSVIIGIALGVSDSPCTIRPLFAALTFHQFFEGFALGGCISQVSIDTFLELRANLLKSTYSFQACRIL